MKDDRLCFKCVNLECCNYNNDYKKCNSYASVKKDVFEISNIEEPKYKCVLCNGVSNNGVSLYGNFVCEECIKLIKGEYK